MTAYNSLPIDKHDVNSEPASQEAVFLWTKQWYPVAVVDFLDPSRPHAMQLLGKNIVLWKDGSGKWRCFEDACPHRLAPFSEGRVEADGTLMCAYHAWRFDGEGNCVNIPQSKDKQTESRHCSNSKSCAVFYPTQEQQGLLWVWAESGLEAQLESQSKQPLITPELENNSDKVVKRAWYFRDLPYGWDFFMENITDPAHVPVSHHGIVGNRYKDAKYYDMISLSEISSKSGFAYEITPTAPNIKQAINDFQPPCLMRSVSILKDGGQLILVLYAIPTRPGWCRNIGCQVLVKNESNKTPPGLGFFGLKMPIWLSHVLASLFLHQDMVFLHYQEKAIAQKKGRWLDKVFTPNPQDKMIIAFRNWLENKAGGGIPWAPECNSQLPPPERDKQKLFDVWSTHTQNCSVCLNALKNINRLTVFSFAISIIFAFLSVMIDARAVAAKTVLTSPEPTNISIFSTLPPTSFWLALLGTLLFASIGYLLMKLRRLFYVYEFEHARNN